MSLSNSRFLVQVSSLDHLTKESIPPYLDLVFLFNLMNSFWL